MRCRLWTQSAEVVPGACASPSERERPGPLGQGGPPPTARAPKRRGLLRSMVTTPRRPRPAGADLAREAPGPRLRRRCGWQRCSGCTAAASFGASASRRLFGRQGAELRQGLASIWRMPPSEGKLLADLPRVQACPASEAEAQGQHFSLVGERPEHPVEVSAQRQSGRFEGSLGLGVLDEVSSSRRPHRGLGSRTGFGVPGTPSRTLSGFMPAATAISSRVGSFPSDSSRSDPPGGLHAACRPCGRGSESCGPCRDRTGDGLAESTCA